MVREGVMQKRQVKKGNQDDQPYHTGENARGTMRKPGGFYSRQRRRSQNNKGDRQNVNVRFADASASDGHWTQVQGVDVQ